MISNLKTLLNAGVMFVSFSRRLVASSIVVSQIKLDKPSHKQTDNFENKNKQIRFPAAMPQGILL
jgi:hypothetical protein